MPRVGTGESYLTFKSLGEGPFDWVRFILTRPVTTLLLLFDHPIKTTTIEAMLSSWSYLPLLSPLALLTGLPSFLARFLSDSPGRWQLFWHYSANITPTLAFGTIMAVGWLVEVGQKRGLDKKKLTASFAVLLLLTVYFRNNLYQPPLWKLNDPSYLVPKEGLENVLEILQQVPKEGSVLSQSPLVPRLSHRREIYLLGLHEKQTDYVVLATNLDSYPLSTGQLQERVNHYSQDQSYELLAQKGEVYLFKKKDPNHSE